jgi:uncharacterized repeat protein (TIGR02543 family)
MNGATDEAPASIQVTYDETYGELPAVTRTGYDFGGWYTEAENGSEVKSTTKVTATQGHKLYAHWTADTYTVSFDMNGATGNAPDSIQVTYDESYGALPVVTRTGYGFAGWYTEAENGAKVELTTKVMTASGHTLYAHWSHNPVAVNYYLNYSNEDTTLHDSIIGVFDITLSAIAAPERSGYTFTAWTTSRGAGGAPYVPGETIVDVVDTLNLYAHWTANGDTEYKVNHYWVKADGNIVHKNTDNLTGMTDTPVTATPKTYTGYTYKSGYSSGAAVELAEGVITGDGKLELKLYYPVNRNSVTYQYDASKTLPTNAPEVPVDYHDNHVPYGTQMNVKEHLKLDGYDFSGWSTSHATVDSGTFQMPDRNVVFEGHFTPRSDTPYQVEHYLVDANNVATLDTYTSHKGITDTTVDASVLEHAKTYKGYRHDPGHNDTVLSGLVESNGTLTLKLYYTLNSYTVEYDLNEGTGSAESRSASWFDTGLIPGQDPERGYHEFEGWQTEEGIPVDATTPYSALVADDDVESVLLIAQWKYVGGPDDIDGDGIPNGEDDDVDGDGIPNGEDDDVDGDGIPNGEDDDVDGDGIPNGEDEDVDGDGIPKGEDDDVDGDGIPNGEDDEFDGDIVRSHV